MQNNGEQIFRMQNNRLQTFKVTEKCTASHSVVMETARIVV